MANVNKTIIEIEAGETDDSTVREIYRNLQVLYGTATGEQALDRDFGIDASVTDLSSGGVRSRLVAEYVRKTQQYEPRATVSSVEWVEDDTNDGNIIPKVVIEIV